MQRNLWRAAMIAHPGDAAALAAAPSRDYPVNEIFETIQGEATHAGRPSVFVRLQGCAVGCAFCDTKHTWAADPVNKDFGVIAALNKTASSPAWVALSVTAILGAVLFQRANHVVITGGEPCDHDLRPLCSALAEAGRTVQIETSGTAEIKVNPNAWVTVSPKINQAGGKRVLASAMLRADEIKHPVGKMADVTALLDLLSSCPTRPGVPIWLQPLSMSKAATALCREIAIVNNWRVSLQLHAYAGWR